MSTPQEPTNYPRCGAIAKHTGKPCQNLAGKGTDHPGTGRCKHHGGSSKGPKTEEGKSVSAQNSRKHGLYAKILTGSDRVRFEAVQEFEPGEILRDNFYLVQARVLGLLEGDGKFSKDARTLLQACAILVENQELSEEFVDELRLRLLGLDIEKLSKIFNSTTNLANAAQHLDKMGDVKRQLAIAKDFIVNVLRSSSDHIARTLAIATISELKLEAGLPVDTLDEILAQSQEEEVEEVEEVEGVEGV